jgi:phage pi2 protein 07
MDYQVNSFVFIANSIYRTKKELKLVKDIIDQLYSLESFRINIQLKSPYKNKNIPIKLTPELNKYIGALKRCAACYYYEEKNDKWVLDFYINDTTKNIFKKYFNNAFDAYNTSLHNYLSKFVS